MALPPLRRSLPPAPSTRRQPQGGILSNLKSLQGYDGGTGAFGAHMNKGNRPEPRVTQKPQESKKNDIVTEKASQSPIRSEKAIKHEPESIKRQKSASPPRKDDKISKDTDPPANTVENRLPKEQNHDREPVKSPDRDKRIQTPEHKSSDRESEDIRPSSSDTRKKENNKDVKDPSTPTRGNSAQSDRNDHKQNYSPITRKRESPNQIRTENKDGDSRMKERAQPSMPPRETENINTQERKREIIDEKQRTPETKPKHDHKKDSSPKGQDSSRPVDSSDDTEKGEVMDRDIKKKTELKSEEKIRHRDDHDGDNDGSSDNSDKRSRNAREKQRHNRQTARKPKPSSSDEEEPISPDIAQSPEKTIRRDKKKQSGREQSRDSKHASKDKEKTGKSKRKQDKKISHVSRRDKDKVQDQNRSHTKDKRDKMDQYEKKVRKRSESRSTSSQSDLTSDEKDFVKTKGPQRSASLESRSTPYPTRQTRKSSPSPERRHRYSHRNRSVDEMARAYMLPPQYVREPNPAYYPAPVPYIGHNVGYTYDPWTQPRHYQTVVAVPAHNTLQYPAINNVPYVYEYKQGISTALPQQNAAPSMVHHCQNLGVGTTAILNVQSAPLETPLAPAPVNPVAAVPVNPDTTDKPENGGSTVVNQVNKTKKKKKPHKTEQQLSMSDDNSQTDDDDSRQQRISEKSSAPNKLAKKTSNPKKPKSRQSKQSNTNNITPNQQKVRQNPDREYKRMLKDFYHMFPNQNESSPGAVISHHPDSKLSNREYVERVTDGSLPFLRDLNSLRDNVNASQGVRKSTRRH